MPLGYGNGTFAASVASGLGTYLYSITVGDFNRDGRPDIAAVISPDNSIRILLGNGDGTFVAVYVVGVGSTLGALAVSDFNADGKLDLVAGYQDVHILLGNGDGTLTLAATYGGGTVRFLAVGDLNGDGTSDIVSGDAYGVGVLVGNGDGSFRVGNGMPAPMHANAIAVGNFDGDGKLDLVITTSGGVVAVLRNTAPDVTTVRGVTGSIVSVLPGGLFMPKLSATSADDTTSPVIAGVG